MSQSERSDDVEPAPRHEAAAGHEPVLGQGQASAEAAVPDPAPASTATEDGVPEGATSGREEPSGDTDAGGSSDAEAEGHLPEGATPGPAVSAAEAMVLVDPQMRRRAPRYGRFAMTGVVLGIVVCAIAVLLFAEPNEYRSLPGVFLLVSVVAVPIFALLACLLAVLLDRRRSSSHPRRMAKG